MTTAGCLSLHPCFDDTQSFFDSLCLSPVSTQSLPSLCSSCFSITSVFLHSLLFLISALVHPHSVHLCSPPPYPMLPSCLTVCCVAQVFLVIPSLLRFSQVLAMLASVHALHIFSFFLCHSPSLLLRVWLCIGVR